MPAHFIIRTLDDMDAPTWHTILQLRAEVFVVEQYCAYADPDELDRSAYHMYEMANGEVIAYQRLLPPGVAYEESSIGRIIIRQGQRGHGRGADWVRQGIAWLLDHFPGVPIRISAQSRLLTFYRTLGFEVCGGGYLEDGIPHVGMLYPTD